MEERTIEIRTRANVNLVSASNAYCFASPSCVKADSNEVTRLTCFCLNNRGLGVSNIQLDVEPASSSVQDLIIEPIQTLTDEFGQGKYDIRSTEAGQYVLRVSCGDTMINSTPQVCFQ